MDPGAEQTARAAERSPRGTEPGQRLGQRMIREDERLALALLLSLLIHALLLSLTFGGQGLGLPGLDFLWRDRRTEVPEVSVVLVPGLVAAGEPAISSAAKPLQQASIEQRAAAIPPLSPAPAPGGKTAAIPPAARNVAEPKSKRTAVPRAPAVKARSRADKADSVAPAQTPEPAAVHVAPSEEPAPVAGHSPPTPVIAVPPS